MINRRTILFLAAAAAVTPAWAQKYPERPVTVVVPFPVGGSVDAAVRLLQPRLAQELGQAVVVENVSGAGGALGAAKVAAAMPDGYTLLAGTINDVVLAPVLNRNLRYRPQDLLPIGPISSTPPMIVARKDLPANDIDGVIELARKKDDGLSYASPGVGTFQHLVMEDLQRRAKVRMLHVPYKGAAPIINDLIAGMVDLAVMVPATALPHIENGRLKAIGVASPKRLSSLKNFPTLNESRYVSGMEADGWMGLFGPKGLPADRAARVRAALQAALADRQASEKLLAMGMQLPASAQRSGFAEQIGRDEAKARSITVHLQ